MFQFPEFPPYTLSIRVSATSLQLAGFPHSDIKGSMPACGSPLLFAACHVLLRRLVPWHPPCALVRLITLLRLRYILPVKSLTFFATGLLKTLLVFRLCSCQGARAIACPFRIQNPENDTELRAAVLSLDISGFSPSCPSFDFRPSGLPSVSFTDLSAIDLRLKLPLSIRLAP